MVSKSHLRKSSETAAVPTDIQMSVQTAAAENYFNNSLEFQLGT